MQKQPQEVSLLRIENQRKDKLIDDINGNTAELLKKVHAKLGVCLDHRLSMTLGRAQGILREVCRVID